MKSIVFINKTKEILDKEHHNSALYEIEQVNLARFRIMLVILFINEIMFIIFNDIPYIFYSSKKIIWQDSGYFVLHLLLSATSVIGFVLANRLIHIDKEKWKRSYRYFTTAILIIYLILISLLNSLDQAHINKISSIFIANLLICGGIFIINFPRNLITYVIPCVCYMGTFLYLGYDKAVLYSNLINCIIFLFAIVIISTTIYNNQYEGIVKNISLDRANNQLNYISNHDPLTGLLNRRCFLEKLEKMQETGMQRTAVILVDIDFFKAVNDKFGHPVGDIILQEVSSVLMKYIKKEDLAVRWGGEEFLLFIYDTSAPEAYVMAETIRKAIEELTIHMNEYKIKTTASFGVAAMNDKNSQIFSSAYKAADIALYQAKAQGRNCVVAAED